MKAIKCLNPTMTVMSTVTRHFDTIGVTDISTEGILHGLEMFQKYNLLFSKLISTSSDTFIKGAKGVVIAKLRETTKLSCKAAVKVLPLIISSEYLLALSS